MTPEEKPSSAEPGIVEQLEKFLDDANMQVTLTGWRAELEAAETKLRAQAAQVAEAIEKLEALSEMLNTLAFDRIKAQLDAALALLKKGEAK